MGRRDRQELYMRILGKPDFGRAQGSVQFKTKALISIRRTGNTIMFLKERTTNASVRFPKMSLLKAKV